MKTASRIKSAAFILFLLLAVFGSFSAFVVWMHFRNPLALNPAGENYLMKPSEISMRQGLVYFDFEGEQPPEVVFRAPARSGKHSLAAEGRNSRSPVVNIPLSAFEAAKSGQFGIQAWLNILSRTEAVDAELVFLITCPANMVLFSNVVPVRGENFTENEWFRLTSSVAVPEGMYSENGRVRIYLRNKSNSVILLDDLMILAGKQDMQGDYLPENAASTAEWLALPNVPPYPPRIFSKTEGGQSAAEFLSGGNTGKNGGSLDFMIRIAGYFTRPYGGTEDLLCLTSSGADIFRFGAEENRFSAASGAWGGLAGPERLRYFKGDFDGDSFDELLLLHPHADSCLVLKFRVAGQNRLQVTEKKYAWPHAEKYVQLCALECSTAKKHKILALDAFGGWAVLVMNAGGEGFRPERTGDFRAWGAKGADCRLFPLHYLAGGSSRQILLVCKAADGASNPYVLLEYDSNSGCMPVLKTEKGQGLVVGRETLEIDDEMFPLYDETGKPGECIRLRSGWRFDMKTIAWNDTAFTVCGSVDFSGFAPGANPKYYENLRIIPGRFLHPARTALLVTAQQNNTPQAQWSFPNIVHMYVPHGK